MDRSDQIVTEAIFLQVNKVYVPRLIVFLKEEFNVDAKKNVNYSDMVELISPFTYKFVNSIPTHTFLPRYLERVYWTSTECKCVNDFYQEVIPLIEEEGRIFKLQVFPSSRTLKIGDGIMCHLEAKAIGQFTAANPETASIPSSSTTPTNTSVSAKPNSRKKNSSAWIGTPPSRPDTSILPPEVPAKLLSKLSPTNYTHILYIVFPHAETDQRLLYGIKSAEHAYHRNEVEYCAPTSKSTQMKKQKNSPSPSKNIQQQKGSQSKNNNNTRSSEQVEEEENEEEEEEVISRAYFKLRESMERFHIKLPSNIRAVDVGASPGGMTQFFSALIENNNPGIEIETVENSSNPYQVSKTQLDKGIVFAIDPAALRINPKNVLHLQLKAEQALDHIKQYAPFDIIVCDINALPFHAINIFQPFVPFLKEGGYLVWTVKRYWTCVHMEAIEKEFLERFPNTFKSVQIKWLLANKNERMLCAQK